MAEQEAGVGAKNVIFFRSTEAIIYYLGEIVRHQARDAPKPLVRWQRPDGTAEDVALFVARTTSGGRRL